MEKQVSFILWHDDDSEENVTVAFPAKYVVCYDCSGSGTTYLGWRASEQPAFTQEEMAYEGVDFQEDYMSGRYDKQCPACKGKRVVLEIQEKFIPEDKKKLWKAYQEHLEAEHDYWAECEAERRAGC